jgi:NAD(P)-dependent dehydrogenase (short-subunit alcohol dehydrogenase family)
MSTPASNSAFLQQTFGLQGKAVFLTGASSGIGEHWAWTLAKAGASHLALAARRADKLEVLAGAIRKAHPLTKVAVVQCDVGDVQSIRHALDTASSKLEGVTFQVIINNAGVGPSAPVLEATPESVDDTMNINVRGPFVLSQEAAKRMIAKGLGGSIINVASIYGLRVGFNNGVYAMSKAAMVQMTKAMAIELLSQRIRVNCIAPGYYRSEMTADFYDSPAGIKYLKEKVPSKRLGRLEELDGPLLLLASDASSNMTGSVVVADGGHSSSSL